MRSASAPKRPGGLQCKVILTSFSPSKVQATRPAPVSITQITVCEKTHHVDVITAPVCITHDQDVTCEKTHHVGVITSCMHHTSEWRFNAVCITQITVSHR